VVLSEPTRRHRGAAAASPAQADRPPYLARSQNRLENTVEVGKTMLVLTLVALGIVALRYMLVLADGILRSTAGQ
jgi:hypothetical protein